MVRSIQRDFALMQRLAQLASLLPALRKMQLGETLAQFAAPLQEQVGLIKGSNRSSAVTGLSVVFCDPARCLEE